MSDAATTQHSATDLDLTIDEQVFAAPGGGWHEELVDANQDYPVTLTFQTSCWGTCRFTCGDCVTIYC
jgi:hypothetical protein